MAEKTIKTRITLKHDTAANWGLVPNFVPKMAEPIIYENTSSNESPKMKIGNGIDKIADLPFIVEALSNSDIDSIIAVPV